MTGHRKRAAISLIALLAIASSVTSTQAQPEDMSRVLSPLIDERTVAILRIDLTRVDIEAFHATALEIMRQSESTTPSAEEEAGLLNLKEKPKQWLSQFTAAGGKTIYALWGTANPLDVLIAIPVASATDALALNSQIAEIMSKSWTDDQLKQTHKDNLILIGMPSTLEKWNRISPTARPELQQATTTIGPGAIQLFLIPNTDTRRVVEALLPAVSEQRVVPETNAIIKGLQWAALSIDLPPHPSLKLHIESADAASASALRDTLIKGYEVIAQMPQLQHIGHPLREALNTLTPTVQGHTLRLAEDKKCIELVTHFIVPTLVEAEETAERITCATNLSGMGKAILIYANDYEDKFPPNLDRLVDTVEFPHKGLACPSTRRNPDYSSYVYRGVDLKGIAAPPNLIVVHDRKGNHRDGRNVLYVDTHVDWVAEEDFARAIKRDNEIRVQHGYPPKPVQ